MIRLRQVYVSPSAHTAGLIVSLYHVVLKPALKRNGFQRVSDTHDSDFQWNSLQ
jgi:hypothetical protein